LPRSIESHKAHKQSEKERERMGQGPHGCPRKRTNRKRDVDDGPQLTDLDEARRGYISIQGSDKTRQIYYAEVILGEKGGETRFGQLAPGHAPS